MYSRVFQKTPFRFPYSRSQPINHFKLKFRQNNSFYRYIYNGYFFPRSGVWKIIGMAFIGGTLFYLGTKGAKADSKSNKTVSMRGIIPAFAKVQDALKLVGYTDADKYPQIVVIGIQSSGKSSVLEMIVGEEFIPKGEGTVTKRPLVLTLHNTTNTNEKWAYFPELNNQKITDFEVVKSTISRQNTKFSSIPLRLEIYSPDVVDLRMIDLPGLIHNPTREQPQDTRNLIKQTVMNYIQNDKTVILAVTEGNTDLQTSEALRISRKVDPNGERTISVLTKLDLVPNKDIPFLLDTLSKLPLKLGYVGVKCRNKQERDEGMTIPGAIKSEEEFFQQNTQFASNGIAVGSTGLAMELSSMLERRVILALPEITEKMRADLLAARKELNVLGIDIPKNSQERDKILLQEMENFLSRLLGASTIYEIKIEIAQLIYKTIYDRCTKSLEEFKLKKPAIKPLPSRSSKDKTTLPPSYWEGQEDIQFKQWQEHVGKLVVDLQPLSEELTHAAIKLLREKIDDASQVISHRPMLREVVKNATLKYLNKSFNETVKRVEYLFELEKNISYDSKKMEERYNDLLHASDDKKQKKTEEKKQESSGYLPSWWGSKQESQNNAIIITGKYGELWTEAYYDHMAERLSTNIYNAICVEVLDPLRSKLTNTFTVELYGDEKNRDNLLKERGDILKKRQLLVNKIEELENSSKILDNLLMNI